MKKLHYIVLLLIISSCSASWHVKRAKKLDPSLFEVKVETKIDTVKLEVPVITEKVLYDTLVEVIQSDPITKVKTVIRYKIKNDTIMIDCPDPEVITVTDRVTETIVIKPTIWDKLEYVAYGLLLLFILKKLLLYQKHLL